MNQLQQIFNYEEVQVRTFSKNGEVWFVAKDVCDVLEITKYRDAVARLDEDERGSVLVDTLGGSQAMAAINEWGVYTLILTSRKPEAKAFKRWITHDVIPSIRNNGFYAVDKPSFDDRSEQIKLDAIALEVAVNVLRVNEGSKIKMLHDFNKSHGLSTAYLPAYTEEQITRSASELLKMNNAQIGAVRFNKALLALGILEEKERPSSKGGTKKFKSLTEEGLKYGKNLISASNQKESQPHYYESTFPQLLELLK